MSALISKLVKEDNFLSLLGNLTIAIFGFLGFAIIARTQEPNDFAKWVLFISGGSLVEMFRYGITSNALVRFLSGGTPKSQKQLIGSNVFVSLISTAAIVILMLGTQSLFKTYIDQSPYDLFFQYYPILALVNLPLNNAIAVQQAKMNYGIILIIRALNSVVFFIFLMSDFFFFDFNIETIVVVFIGCNLLCSLVCLIKSWDGFTFIKHADKEKIATLLNFGKYSTFTLVGTNLLRNADILIISISPFGSAAVALFSIPLKLTEIYQIPLRSFVATAFPKMSKASLEGNIYSLQSIFNTYSGVLTYLFCFGSLLTFIFAKQFVILISGYQYLENNFMNIDIVMIVRILSVYGVLLPIDRMTGIALDSINMPKINALKVGVMLVLNIAGDFLALYFFKSVEMVAVSTLVFSAVGISIGLYFLGKNFSITPLQIIKRTNTFYKSLWTNIYLNMK